MITEKRSGLTFKVDGPPTFKSENARLNGAADTAQGYDRGHHFLGIATRHAWQRRALPSEKGVSAPLPDAVMDAD